MDTTPQFLLIPVIELELLEDNPREISEKEMKSLCNDIRKDPNFLMQRPPLVNYSDGRMVVYAGNQRVRAAIRNGLSEIHCWVEKNVPLAVQQDRKRHWSKLFDSQETREGVELIAKSGQSSAVYELRNKMRQSQGKDPSWDEIIIEAKKRGLHIYEGK